MLPATGAYILDTIPHDGYIMGQRFYNLLLAVLNSVAVCRIAVHFALRPCWAYVRPFQTVVAVQQPRDDPFVRNNPMTVYYR